MPSELLAGPSRQQASFFRSQQTERVRLQHILPFGQQVLAQRSRLSGQPHLPLLQGSSLAQHEPPHFPVPRGHVPLQVPLTGSHGFERGQQKL